MIYRTMRVTVTLDDIMLCTIDVRVAGMLTDSRRRHARTVAREIMRQRELPDLSVWRVMKFSMGVVVPMTLTVIRRSP